DAFGFVEDGAAALAVVADGMGSGGLSGRNAADLTVDTCTRIFQQRASWIMDDLAELWWIAEHGAGESSSYATLPMEDRSQLRERAATVLERRVPDCMGDIALLEGERCLLLAIPRRGLELANVDVFRRSERDPSRWRGHGAAAACAIFAGGQASIAHAGDCR